MSASDHSPRFVAFGAFEVDLTARELKKHGVRVKLQDQPLTILCRLLQEPGDLVTRGQLRDELWPEGTFVDFDHGLNEAVNRLRAALGDSAENPRFIETLPRKGYRFIAAIDPAKNAAGAPGSRRRLAILALALAGVVGVSAMLGRGWLESVRKPETGAPSRTVAVLPLLNLSGDTQQDYLADGMTEELIALLARVPGLHVISRTSVLKYRGARTSLRDVGRELNADAVVEGSVRLAGGRVRVTAQLLDVQTERSLWGETYERELEDVLELQQNVAHAIARAIQGELTRETRSQKPRRVDPATYQAYLKGRFHWNRRTEEGLRRAIAHFQEAIASDPGYAPAYAGLSDCYRALGAYNLASPSDVMSKAKAAAEKAIEIDDDAAEPHASLGSTLFLYEWNWTEAERELRRATALNPGYASAHQWLAVFLTAMGRMEEAVPEIQRARELDPLSLSINEIAGWVRYCAREYDPAIRQFEWTLELDPHYVHALKYLGLTYLKKGEATKAMQYLEKARQAARDDTEVQVDVALSYALAGNKTEARRALSNLLKRGEMSYVSPYLIAGLYTGLEENDRAIEWLEKAIDERAGNVVFLAVDPLFDRLKSDPRFLALVRRIGLPVSEGGS